MASTVAMATARFSPPERRYGGRSARCSRADARERVGDARRDVLGRQPEVERPEPHVLGDGRHEELVVRVLEDHADRAADVGQRPLGHRDAADVDASRAPA